MIREICYTFDEDYGSRNFDRAFHIVDRLLSKREPQYAYGTPNRSHQLFIKVEISNEEIELLNFSIGRKFTEGEHAVVDMSDPPRNGWSTKDQYLGHVTIEPECFLYEQSI